MNTHSDNKIRLQASSDDYTTEISIIDKHFNKVASALGQLDILLAPGIYKVRWKTANASEDELIEITGNEDDSAFNLPLKTLAINTPAPLAHSTHKSDANAALMHTLTENPPPLHPEKPCQLLVFLRDDIRSQSEFPVDSVNICTVEGTTLANVKDGIINHPKRCAGINIGVSPGVYRLRVRSGPIGEHEIFIPATAGWQTQIFLNCDDVYLGSEIIRRPTLRTATILMRRTGHAFDPNSNDARLAESALNSLRRDYDILDSNDMRDLLHGKFDDPMLGIYAAHLLLRRKRVNWDTYNTVCKNLQKLVGPLPDVQALLTKSRDKLAIDKEKLALYEGLPPMLVHSWDILANQSHRRFSTIPQGSVADQIADSVVSTAPWLICQVKALSTANKGNKVSYARSKKVLEKMAEQLMQSNPEERSFRYLVGKKNELDPIENTIMETMAAIMPKNAVTASIIPQLKQPYVPTAPDQSAQTSIDVSAITHQALSKLPLPSYSIARSTISLASKLDLDIT